MTWWVKKIVVRLRLFCAGFWRFCNSQNCASRSRLTILVRQRYRHRLFVRRCRLVAQMFSCRSPRGEFCEPPQGGASARTAEAGLYFYKPQSPEHLFSLPTRVAASCLFQSAAEFANNSVVCHSEEQSDEESVSSIRRQILDCTAFVFLLLARHSPQAVSALAAFVDPLRST